MGCYSPSALTGVPCSSTGTCPGAQICDTRVEPPVCVDELGVLVDAGPDATPPCVTSSECPASLPVCGTEQVCRRCIADSECPSDVCHELAGTCVDEASVLYVAPGAVGLTCTRAAPCGDLAQAIQARGLRTTVKVADGTYTGDGFEFKTEPGAGTSLVISGPDVSWDGPVITSSNRGHLADLGTTLVIEGVTFLGGVSDGLDNRSTLTLSHVLIQGSANNGLDSRNAAVKVYDSRIEASGGTGVFISDVRLDMERSTVIGSANVGINVANAGLKLVNSIIGSNGSLTTTYGGIRINPAGVEPIVFRHNTIARNRGANISGVQCDQAVVIENSIFSGNSTFGGPEYSGNCSPRHSLFSGDAPQGMGNKMGEPLFVSTTDFHIQAGSDAVDAADAANSEPLDIDGQARPMGNAPDVGADELP